MIPGRARRLGTALGAAVVTLVAGCGTLGPTGVRSGPADLLAFNHYADNLDDEERRREVRKFRNWVQEGQCSADRLRLVLLLMKNQGATAGTASDTLAPCLAANEGAPRHLRNLVQFLDQHLKREQALLERIQALEAQREDLEYALEKSQAKRQQLATERNELKRQLEALKDIERSIRQRD